MQSLARSPCSVELSQCVATKLLSFECPDDLQDFLEELEGLVKPQMVLPEEEPDGRVVGGGSVTNTEARGPARGINQRHHFSKSPPGGGAGGPWW